MRPLHAAPEPPEPPSQSGGLTLTAEQLARMFPGDPSRARREARWALQDYGSRKLITGPTERPANVRVAGVEDERDIWPMLETAYHENGHMFAALDPDRAQEHMRAGTRRKGAIVGVIDNDNGLPVATIGLIPMQWWWSKQFFIQDLWNYVRPEYRKSNMANDLATFSKWCVDEWARGFGYPVYLITGVQSIHRTREKVRLLRRHYNEIGASFIYPAPPGMKAVG